jgi:hypothetical protein
MELASDLLALIYRRILRIRFFEEAVVDLKGKGEIPGAAPDIQIPFAPEMESPLYPNADRVVAAVENLLDA